MQVFDRDLMKRLGEAYEDESGSGFVFNRVIRVHIEALHDLATAIDADMDSAVGGVRWWVGHPVGDRRRILIADHLLQCVMSIEKNLVDARLHQLALEHCSEVERRMTQHAVTARRMRDGIGLSVDYPRAVRAADDLPRSLGDLHRVGFFQAVGSVVDCLGGAIVGVLGLAADLLRSDLSGARKLLQQHAKSSSTTDDATFLRAFGLVLEAQIAAAGPQDWLDWATDMRNMYMHRARRLQLATMNTRYSGIVDEREDPQMLTDTALHLPRSPSHSDVEVMLATNVHPVLEEDADTTIAGIMESLLTLVGESCGALHRAWLLRRASPTLIPQPLRQWAKTPATQPSRFPGYAPGSRPFQVESLHGSPSSLRRMQVALLLDHERYRWSSFPP